MHLMHRSICNQSPSFTIEFLLLNQHINFIESFGLYLCRKTDNIPFFVYFLQKNETIFKRKLFWIKHSSHFECRFFLKQRLSICFLFQNGRREFLLWSRIFLFVQEFRSHSSENVNIETENSDSFGPSNGFIVSTW